MVLRYARSVKSEESLRLYQNIQFQQFNFQSFYHTGFEYLTNTIL
jgi:hypothetical protein